MKYSVIIVEDDPSYQAIVSSFVESNENLELLAVVDNPDAAKAEITKHKPDILLLDMLLGGDEGLEILDEVDWEPVTLVISGNPYYKFESSGFEVVDFIEKPIKYPHTIKTALDACIKRCEQKNS